MKRIVPLAVVIAVTACLLIVTSLAAPPKPAVEDRPAAAPAGATVEVVGVRVALKNAEDKFGNSYVPGTTAGVSIHFRVHDAKRQFLGIDKESVKVLAFTDDQKTDLNKTIRWTKPGLGPFTRVSEDGHSVVFGLRTAAVPAKGARELRLKVQMLLKSGSKPKTVVQKGVALKKGATFQAGPARFEIVEVSEDRFTLQTKDAFDAIDKLDFLVDGKPAGVHEKGSSRFGETKQLFLQVNPMPKTLDVQCTYFQVFETIPVRIDRKIGVGL